MRVGWTQYSFGTADYPDRGDALQLLMGNAWGARAGGVKTLRGHSNIQARRMPPEFSITLPGYSTVPTPTDTDSKAWMTRITPTSSKAQ